MTALGFLGVACLGAVAGCITGLFPGLHVNTLAVLLVAVAPSLTPAAAHLGLPPEAQPLAVPGFVLAIAVAHAFVTIVPATYLGAPDERTALSVLPAHRLLMRGEGYRAVSLSAYAAFAGTAASLLLFFPLHWLLTGPLGVWEAIRRATPWLLVALVVFLLWREPGELGPVEWTHGRRRWFARWAGLQLFLAAGVYGLLALDLPYDALLPFPASPLLPMLSGLYGAATLLEALAQQAKLPHQFLRSQDPPLSLARATGALGVGVAAGATMSLLPALTNASATAVAGAARTGSDEEALVSLGSVGAANGVFNLLVLYAFERARSGAVVALERLVPLEPWAGPAPAALVWFLFMALAAATLALVVTLALGRWAARKVHVVPYRSLVIGVCAYATLVVLLFSGWLGLFVFVIGAALGLVPVRLGLQRTHLTGVLLVPVLGYFFT